MTTKGRGSTELLETDNVSRVNTGGELKFQELQPNL